MEMQPDSPAVKRARNRHADRSGNDQWIQIGDAAKHADFARVLNQQPRHEPVSAKVSVPQQIPLPFEEHLNGGADV